MKDRADPSHLSTFSLPRLDEGRAPEFPERGLLRLLRDRRETGVCQVLDLMIGVPADLLVRPTSFFQLVIDTTYLSACVCDSGWMNSGPGSIVRRNSTLEPHWAWIREQVRSRPGIAVRELARRVNAFLGVAVGRDAVWRFLKRCGPVFKR